MMEALSNDWMLPKPYCLKRIRKETYDIFTINIVPDDGNESPPFAPGQFNMIYVYGIGEVPISISGNPAQFQMLVHTIRSVGTVTRALCHLKTGQLLGIRGPFGTHWPVEEALRKDVVIIAGGIGLAPLRPVMYYLLAHRKDYGKIILLYGARSPNDLLFQKELQKWRANLNLEVQITVDTAPADWYGNIGVVTKLIPLITVNPENSLVMVCGPEIMMRFTIMELRRYGINEKGIYVSMERNMKCGIGLCGHCQYGALFICKDGPVFRLDQIANLFGKREI